MSDNDAEELLPVALFDKGHQDHDHAGSQPGNPRGRGDRVQGRDPRRRGHRLTRGAMPWEGSGTRVITPEACVTVCLAVLEVIPDKVERTRRGTSCQVAAV